MFCWTRTSRLRFLLTEVDAVTVEFMGWKGVRNGELTRRARDAGLFALVTADGPLARMPQVWAPLGCVLVSANAWPRLRRAAAGIDAACAGVLPGEMLIVMV